MPDESAPIKDRAWIFLSHSHKDFDEVRRIRNKLESRGHHPLIFFLKCMDDDSELDDLVKREIEAREWFILCKSKNSEASRWVQREVEMITADPTKAHAIVDLSAPEEAQLEQALALGRRASVFISYHTNDADAAREISRVLRGHDFGVLDESLGHAAIREAADHGFVLVLLSSTSVASDWIKSEARLALSAGHRNIIPITLESPVPEMQALGLPNLPVIDFSTGSVRENAEKLVAELKTREMQ